MTLAAEYKDQEHTERGGYDFRQQYPLVGTAFDPREVGFDRFNAWYGEPEMEQLTSALRLALAEPSAQAADGSTGPASGARVELLGERATLAYGPSGTVELVREHGLWKIEDFQ